MSCIEMSKGVDTEQSSRYRPWVATIVVVAAAASLNTSKPDENPESFAAE